ncbi:hypothetical protein DPEC_G00192590 [Dallia pectoralis]|uniref:Uncharacterized protein n=1 Tax=Dallia pectoralis TaxID=75939 RepID=A0ACC2GCF0_DALPE|nr:hypothetical protein DPEC_G00192590 [Dallia pectoralis]
MAYGYPQRNPQVVVPPNPNNQINNGPIQQNLVKPTQKPQLPRQPWPKVVQTGAINPPPDHRGDTADTGIDEGRPNFPFLFEP